MWLGIREDPDYGRYNKLAIKRNIFILAMIWNLFLSWYILSLSFVIYAVLIIGISIIETIIALKALSIEKKHMIMIYACNILKYVVWLLLIASQLSVFNDSDKLMVIILLIIDLILVLLTYLQIPRYARHGFLSNLRVHQEWKFLYIPAAAGYILLLLAIFNFIEQFWGPIGWLIGFVSIAKVSWAWGKSIWPVFWLTVMIIISIVYSLEGYLRITVGVEGGVVFLTVGIIGLIYSIITLPRAVKRHLHLDRASKSYLSHFKT